MEVDIGCGVAVPSFRVRSDRKSDLNTDKIPLANASWTSMCSDGQRGDQPRKESRALQLPQSRAGEGEMLLVDRDVVTTRETRMAKRKIMNVVLPVPAAPSLVGNSKSTVARERPRGGRDENPPPFVKNSNKPIKTKPS